MPTLIAVVTADERTTADELAAMMRSALKPGHHVYGDADGNIYEGGLTITALGIRRADGDHYRWNAGEHAGEFASADDAAAHPDEVTHESGDVRRQPAPHGAVTVTDPPIAAEVCEDGYEQR